MFWSDETYRIAGVDRSTLPSLELMFEQVHPDDRAPVKSAIDRAMNGEGDIDLEYRLITRAGKLEHVQLLGRAMRDTSGNVELVGATMDVTSRRRAADELQHAQAALAHVSRVTMLGELAASMAHEINQPLTAIVADASACINWLSATPPVLGELHEALTAIVQDGKRAGDVLTRIRSLLSRSAVAREPCDLSAVIAHVLPLTRSELARQGTVLDVELAREMPPVAADPVELQQVVLNLVLNAAEASRDVAAERRRISVRSFVEQDNNGAVVVCTVEDAGVGFTASDPSRLFDAFYTTKPSGLGMGLSISRSIIERHSGRLWATPNAVHGVTFSFAIPVGR
jgi:PAS domain S-box-containing protein